MQIYRILARPNKVTFTAVPGTAEFAKKRDLKPGDIVSFKHRGFMIGSLKPKSPEIYRVRSDLTWEDLVNGFVERKPTISGMVLLYFLI